MNAIKNIVFRFATQPAWMLLSEAIFVVVMTSRGLFSVEVGGVLGSLMLNGWMLSGCYFLERKFSARFKIPSPVYVILLFYMVVIAVFSFGDGALPYGLSSLYGVILLFFVIYYSFLIAKVGKESFSTSLLIVRSMIFIFGIAFYPVGIWFIQPKVVSILRGFNS